jgi:hypothetical protein
MQLLSVLKSFYVTCRGIWHNMDQALLHIPQRQQGIQDDSLQSNDWKICEYDSVVSYNIVA